MIGNDWHSLTLAETSRMHVGDHLLNLLLWPAQPNAGTATSRANVRLHLWEVQKQANHENESAGSNNKMRNCLEHATFIVQSLANSLGCKFRLAAV